MKWYEHDDSHLKKNIDEVKDNDEHYNDTVWAMIGYVNDKQF